MGDNKLVTVGQLRTTAEEVKEAIADAISNMVITVNHETGNLEYESSTHTFEVNNETGNLEYSSN